MSSEKKHNILAVDDEKSILNSLKRLLRKENYHLFTASSSAEGLEILDKNEMQLVISDQRMPEMSGTEFFAKVKEKYPDILRIILTGYTEVDSITDAINKGHIYKFFLKPWNDQNLILEIRQALEQSDLIKVNKELHERVLIQNKELTRMNNNLADIVAERTRNLELKNQALKLSRAVLEDVPIGVVGVGSDGMIVLLNRMSQDLTFKDQRIEIGKNLSNYFSEHVEEKFNQVLSGNTHEKIERYEILGQHYDISLVPLSGKFKGNGVVMILMNNN